jgi:hypothetical protein
MSRIRADKLVDRLGTGGPRFPNGVAEGFSVTGVITATSFSGNVTGNATGLSGSPNITVTNVSAQDVQVGGALTVTGDLTVNGTTTTIDTVITAVDSLAVEGNVGIGTANPTSLLHLAADSAHQILLKRGGGNPSEVTIRNEGNLAIISSNANGIEFQTGITPSSSLHITQSGNVGINSTVPRGRLDVQGRAHFGGGLVEKFENAGTTLGSQTNNPLSDGNVILFTGNETGNNTINFTGVHSTLSVGESVSFTAILTPNNSGVINALQIDGAAQTIKWSGGTVPSAGASGRDVYTFTLLKIGTGTTDYEVFGAAANYAS